MSMKQTVAVGTGAILAATLFTVSASARDVVTRENGVTRVDAPTTRIRVDEASGDARVKVRAPATKVDVGTERRHVRIRVPYYSGDIRW
jgi:hypothetical protein